eukprot:CAMPEP_0205928784 /NCGR_PEP_ID=MMETSP1325-20131115/24930_1 /ASSEMBLY_ACC=CAM_ASM_000708 /TAXON_ID=236786 /ORGANISM="Florenciella sp., Strain RCC1007" /LENGTH=112 /DNA_ID=CAMNT_0053297899 /DNA_START=71 /DNA_END=410 /DNA_ORIENTATION=-
MMRRGYELVLGSELAQNHLAVGRRVADELEARHHAAVDHHREALRSNTKGNIRESFATSHALVTEPSTSLKNVILSRSTPMDLAHPSFAYGQLTEKQISSSALAKMASAFAM